jgi:hypothetical protein
MLLPAILTVASVVVMLSSAYDLIRYSTVHFGREIVPARVIGYEEHGFPSNRQTMLRVSPIINGQTKGTLLLEGLDLPRHYSPGDDTSLLFKIVRLPDGRSYEQYLLNDFSEPKWRAFFRLITAGLVGAVSGWWWIRLRRLAHGA